MADQQEPQTESLLRIRVKSFVLGGLTVVIAVLVWFMIGGSLNS